MTNFEKNQPNSCFISIGIKAFHMGIPLNGNPYRNSDKYKLWKIGWKRAEVKVGGIKAPKLRKQYFEEELETINCVWCDDEFLEKEKCKKCQ